MSRYSGTAQPLTDRHRRYLAHNRAAEQAPQTLKACAAEDDLSLGLADQPVERVIAETGVILRGWVTYFA